MFDGKVLCSDSESNSESPTFETCLSTKSLEDHIVEVKWVTKKVHYLLWKLNISINSYDYLLNDLNNKCSNLGKTLKWNRRQVSNLTDEFSNCQAGTEERNIKFEKLENVKIHNMDDIYVLRNENEYIFKQRNMFCNIAKIFYTNESDDEISIISIVSDLEDIDCSEFVVTHNHEEQVTELDSKNTENSVNLNFDSKLSVLSCEQTLLLNFLNNV